MKIFKKSKIPKPSESKKTKDTKAPSSSSSSESVGNIFPQSLTANHPPAMPGTDTKSLFVKISYLERDNKALYNKAQELTKLRIVNQEVIDSLLNKDEAKYSTEHVLSKKTKILEAQVAKLERERDSFNVQILIGE